MNNPNIQMKHLIVLTRRLHCLEPLTITKAFKRVIWESLVNLRANTSISTMLTGDQRTITISQLFGSKSVKSAV